MSDVPAAESQNSADSFSQFGTFAMATSEVVADFHSMTSVSELSPVRAAAEPVAAEPVAAEPVAVESVAVESVAVESAAVESAAVEPVAVEPVAVGPVDVGPVAVEPAALEPVALEPVAVEPAAAEPVAVEPAAAEPVAVESAVVEPVATEPVAVTPIVTEPVDRTSSPNHSVHVSLKKEPPAQSSNGGKSQSSALPDTSSTPAAVGFAALSLCEEVQQAVSEAGYDTPTEIQAQIIPHMLDGRDVLAQSQTGTGKTAAFALPILSRVDVDRRIPQILVLTPTRELAMQVARSFSDYGRCLSRLNVVAIYGGQDYETQLRALKRGVQVVVGTPGRVIDHINRGTLDLSGIECLVLDEADEMLNMGFLEDVQFVLEKTPEQRQVALFSATLPGPIRSIAQEYLKDPVRISIRNKTMTAANTRQRALFVAPRDKIDVLTRFVEAEDTDGIIVFTKTRETTVSVAEQLSREGLSATALNGDMPQKIRERTIDQLKKGQLDILVATDVAARGLDVSRISHVFNFDVPNDTESYIHRIGRTGRAGRKGEAIIFLTNNQRHKLRVIERATKQPIEVVKPPTADEINAARIRRFTEKLTETTQQDLSLFSELIADYAKETDTPVIKIAAALAQMGHGDRPFLMTERPRRPSSASRERQQDGDRFDKGDRGPHGRRGEHGGRPDRRPAGPPEAGMERYRIEVGRDDGVKPGNIVGAVANEGGIDGEYIGPIHIHDSYSTIDLPKGMPSEVYQTLQQTRVVGRQLRISPASGRSNENRTRQRKTFGGKKRQGPKRSGNRGGHNR